MADSGVSFVVTVYNKEPFLAKVLEALAAQTGGFQREYIFVDDGSTDRSAEIVRETTSSWQNVRIIEQTNCGPAPATNRGLQEARLPWIKTVDGDDILVNHATELLLEAALDKRCQVAYGYSGQYDPDESFTHHSRIAEPKFERLEDPLRVLLRNPDFNPSCLLFRREMLSLIDGCDERIFLQDYSLGLRLAYLGPVARTNALVAYQPTVAAGRLNRNLDQTLHDTNLALYYLLKDFPDLGRRHRVQALRRAAGRAWLYGRRQGVVKTFSARGLRLLLSKYALFPNKAPERVLETLEVFRRCGNVRVPQPPNSF